MSHDPEYRSTLEALRAVRPDLAGTFDSFHGVSDILAWMQSAGLAQTAVDMIAMDEFEYDFLIRLREGDWLSFGIT